MTQDTSQLRILVTGSRGFIGRNLLTWLREDNSYHLLTYDRSDSPDSLDALISSVDVVVHLAGENRPTDPTQYDIVNTGLTKRICHSIEREYQVTGRLVSLVFASSTQALLENPYGTSKKAAEDLIEEMCLRTNVNAVIFRLCGVFGKWSRPNYNSVVSTFCYNISRGLPIQLQEPDKCLSLVYVDDVVASILACLKSFPRGFSHGHVQPIYTVTVGDLAHHIDTFSKSRQSQLLDNVGSGFLRALYATYLTFIPFHQVSHQLKSNEDSRGKFVEVHKTTNSGQFSYFTAHPGVTRGGHYHHSKNERFLVVSGKALFRFRNILTNEQSSLTTTASENLIVNSIPGWVHDISNIGTDELVVMLWSNERFDPLNPDTIPAKL